MARLPQVLGCEGMQVQKGAHKGRNIAVFTSGGDSQGKLTYFISKSDKLLCYCGQITHCTVLL